MTTLVDCGCETRVYKDESGVDIYYCRIHAAVFDLLAACKRIASDFQTETAISIGAIEDCQAAIRKAEGE